MDSVPRISHNMYIINDPPLSWTKVSKREPSFVAGSPVSWASKNQRVVALSTTVAEYLTGTEAIKEAVWIQSFLHTMGMRWPKILPIKLLGDSQSLSDLAKNPEYHTQSNHIQGKQRYITEMVERGFIEVKYIPTSEMVADAQALTCDKSEYFIWVMGVTWNDAARWDDVACSWVLGVHRIKKFTHKIKGVRQETRDLEGRLASKISDEGKTLRSEKETVFRPPTSVFVRR